jgi:cytochrome c oxidase subunit 1
MAGFHRRWFDGGKAFENTSLQHFKFMGWEGTFLDMNVLISWGAWGLGLAQIPFIINFFWSMKGGKRVTSDNPWNATTLEWNTPTPPPHGNFLTTPVVYRGPYEYSVPGAAKDYSPQWEPVTQSEEEALKALPTPH